MHTGSCRALAGSYLLRRKATTSRWVGQQQRWEFHPDSGLTKPVTRWIYGTEYRGKGKGSGSVSLSKIQKAVGCCLV